MNLLTFTYALMLLFQVLHIFEEIGCGAYKIANTLNKYLIVASFLVVINFTTYILIMQDVRLGYFLGLFTSGVLAIGNGLIHIFGWIKTRTFRDSLGAGFFTGLPLGVIGGIVLIQLIRTL